MIGGSSSSETEMPGGMLRCPRRGPRPRDTLLAVLCVALLGSIVLGAAEALLAARAIMGAIANESIPLWLMTAAVGRNVCTHALLWFPLIGLWGIGWHVVNRRRAGASVQPSAVGILIALAGIVVIPLDLALSRRESVLLMWGGIASGAALAAGVYFLLRVVVARVGVPRATWSACCLILVGLALVAWPVLSFVRSPLWSPGTARAPAVAAQQAANGATHVLWIVLDTVRADHTSVYGYDKPTTPFLAEWARQAVVCDLTISNGMWTLPVHASMFTGLSVREHGADFAHPKLDDARETVAETLRKAGYATAFFSGNPLVSTNTSLVQGADQHWTVYHHRRLNCFSLSYLAQCWGLTPRLPWLDCDYGAVLTNHLLDAWLDEQSGKPTFVFINYMEAHLPYQAPLRYRRMFLDDAQVDRSYDLRQRVLGNLVNRLDLDFNIRGPDFLMPADREVLRRQYDAAIRYLDDRVREVIEMYARRGMLDDTLVVIASDHGEHQDTHALWAHRFLTYQDLIHVVLCVHEPGRETDARIATPVQLSDLHPTILNAALGAGTVGDTPHARDLLAHLAEAAPARMAISEYNGPGADAQAEFESVTDARVLRLATPQTSVVGPRYKYTRSDDGHEELYDLQVDPGELNNIIARHPDQTRLLAEFLDEWLAMTTKHNPTDIGHSPRTRETLRSLGYISGGDDDDE